MTSTEYNFFSEGVLRMSKLGANYKLYEYPPNDYQIKLAALDTGLSEDEKKRLSDLYFNSLKLWEMAECYDREEARRESANRHEFSHVFFVAAKGDSELGIKYLDQCMELQYYNYVDFDRLFCLEGGFPDPDIKIEDIAYYDEEADYSLVNQSVEPA